MIEKQTASAKSLILQWFDANSQPVEKRGKLSSGIDRFFDGVAERDFWSESVTVLLSHASPPRFDASGHGLRVTSCQEGLAVSTVVPGWGFGWRTVFRDDYVYDILSWLAHYTCQYIHRSYVAKALMTSWERDAIVLHPFGSQRISRRYGPALTPVTRNRALAVAVKESVSAWGQCDDAPRSRSRWMSRNTLDPAIHQEVFHFLRGQTLLAGGFQLEALVAFDCVVQSLQTISWPEIIGDPRRNRADFVAMLGLSYDCGQFSECMYSLRNEFAAHAGGWRWWDSGEYIDESFTNAISDFTLRVLQYAADKEPATRRISPAPSSWSQWLIESFPFLFDAIWFRPLS